MKGSREGPFKLLSLASCLIGFPVRVAGLARLDPWTLVQERPELRKLHFRQPLAITAEVVQFPQPSVLGARQPCEIENLFRLFLGRNPESVQSPQQPPRPHRHRRVLRAVATAIPPFLDTP